MAVRALLAAFALAALAPLGGHAEGAKPQDVTVGPVTLQIVETDSGEKELRHGTRVLVKDYSLNEGLAAKFKDTHARVFDVGPGGNACEGWPAVVTVDRDGKVAVDTTLKGECHYFIVATEEDGFVFVERAVPDQDGAVWRFAPGEGLRRLGLLVFRPQPKSSWNDLDKWLDHPLSLFNVAPVDAAIRRLTGRQFGDLALRLRVASEVQKKDDRFLIGTGCQPHACNSDQGFVGIDRSARAVFLAMRSDKLVTTWPAAAHWPAPFRDALKSWQKPD
ncbi:MAG: hypothetical protein V7604_4685 [Hyphomicrobiales bacterium]